MSSTPSQPSKNGAVATPESLSLSTSTAPSTTSSADDTTATTAAPTSSTTAPNTTTAAAATPRIVHIDMTSDTICPWCYIGKRRLQRAIAQLDPLRVTPVLRYHPFFLDSTLSKQSIDKLEHYHAKFGADRTKAMLARMKVTGADEGIAFSYVGKIGSTLLSHRLLMYVQKRAAVEGESEVERWRRVGGMVDILFSSYFEQEEDIADIDTLARLAVKLPELEGKENEVREWLEGKEDESSVQNEVTTTTPTANNTTTNTHCCRYDNLRSLLSPLLTFCAGQVINAYRKGIDGVPHFVFDGQYEVSGGEKAETFLQVFKRLGVH